MHITKNNYMGENTFSGIGQIVAFDDVPIGDVVQGTITFEAESEETSTLDEISCRISFAIQELDVDKMQGFMLKQQTRPRNLIRTNRRRKFRVRKKWFNRYERNTIIGMFLYAESDKGPVPALCVTDARLTKQGINYTATPKQYETI